MGQTDSIFTSVSGGTAPFTYQWSGGLSGPGPIAVNPTSTTTYSVSVIDSAGCASSSQSVTVTVNPALALNLTASSSNLCKGASATLTAVGSGGNAGPYTYSWSPAAVSGAQLTVTPSSSITYTVTLSDNCTLTDPTTTITLNVNPIPVIRFTSDVNQSCQAPLCVHFTGTSSPAGLSSNWNFGDNDSLITSATSAQHCYDSPGAYSVSFSSTDSSGCSATATIPNMINVYVKPKAAFAYNPQPVIEGNPVNFENQSSGAISYQWFFNDPSAKDSSNQGSTLTNPIHTFKDTGRFCIMLIASSNTCADTINPCLEVNQACALPDSVPNVFTPNGDGINDLFIVKAAGLAQLNCTIFNRWGMKIYAYDAIATGWDGRTFSDNTASMGTYYYVLEATCIDGRKKEANGYLQVIK